MNAVTNPALNVNGLGVLGMKAYIEEGQLSPSDALAVIEQRIANRKAAGKAQLTNVVAFRNELDAICYGGNANPMPLPVYAKAAKVQPHGMPTSSPDFSADSDTLAAAIAASGHPIPQLLAALAKHITAGG